jgi:hypothetical protein
VDSEPTRMSALYVGLPDLKVLAVEADRDGLFVSHVEQTCEREGPNNPIDGLTSHHPADDPAEP